MAGRMGMSEKEFRHTTPRYFYFRQKGFESVRLEDARNTRLAAFFSFLPHAKKGKIKTPEDLYRLPGDVGSFGGITEDEKAYLAKVLKVAKNVDVFAGQTMPKTMPEA